MGSLVTYSFAMIACLKDPKKNERLVIGNVPYNVFVDNLVLIESIIMHVLRFLQGSVSYSTRCFVTTKCIHFDVIDYMP